MRPWDRNLFVFLESEKGERVRLFVLALALGVGRGRGGGSFLAGVVLIKIVGTSKSAGRKTKLARGEGGRRRGEGGGHRSIVLGDFFLELGSRSRKPWDRNLSSYLMGRC